MSKDSKNQNVDVVEQIQELLKGLRNSDTSFLFISSEHAFAMSGNCTELLSELMVAMVRYPVVRKLIMEAFISYPSVEKDFGERLRGIKMNYCIEQNSGNDGN